ncbi:MAG: VOC family protein [Hyphomicrobiaceae bacterium]|nr:VOC family protein [Hyphomicrobiaceae bacterium]MCC0009295.1 VOC family protein [Hyphomicrobiaceae bacterium]
MAGDGAPEPLHAAKVLETILYANDIDAAERFYSNILGLEVYARAPTRQVFFKLDDQMLLIFNPSETVIPPKPDAKLPVPPHGAVGHGHVCFTASADEIDRWKEHLQSHDVTIEADFLWPSGGRSIYFRDPAGNCLEFAEPNIWGFKS